MTKCFLNMVKVSIKFATRTKLETTVTRSSTCKCGGIWLTKQWLPSMIRLILWHKWSLSSSLDTKSATHFAKQKLYECDEKTNKYLACFDKVKADYFRLIISVLAQGSR